MFSENIILGAGPAGLQLAYYFKEEGIPYVVLERNAMAASFFTKYPHSRKLISINKKNVGTDHPDFALRHDWNSLIDASGARFTERTDDYYPDRDDLVAYMNEFAARNELNIEFMITVLDIRKIEDGYELKTQDSMYICKKIIIATGLSLPNLPRVHMNVNVKKPILHYSQYPPGYFQNRENLHTFKNKKLLIFGNGNSALELGNLLNPLCSSIILMSRGHGNWAMSTHYVGHIRSIYLPFLDTFLLKSLNGIDIVRPNEWIIEQEEDKYKVFFYRDIDDSKKLYEYKTGFDHIIFCTGWRFDNSIFRFPLHMTPNDKYPQINKNYESTNNKNLFFIGSLMHSLDYGKGSGGFIHGFRYLLKYFVSVNYTKKYDICTLQNDELVPYILYKINKTSALYQLYGQICDIIHLGTKITYVNNVHISSFVLENYSFTIGIICKLTLEYGDKVTEFTKIASSDTKIGNESKALLLHPILRFYDANLKLFDEIHLDEDLLADFESDTSKYKDRLDRIFRMFTPPTSSAAPSNLQETSSP
jgi:thioredoxin reductase